jgi:hypothetical protein
LREIEDRQDIIKEDVTEEILEVEDETTDEMIGGVVISDNDKIMRITFRNACR